MERLNNKGFTLIELLAALVILTAIMGIAIPSISSSLERTKKRHDDSKKRVLESAEELWVNDNKNVVYDVGHDRCYIELAWLDVAADNLEDYDGNQFRGVIVFDRLENTYTYEENYADLRACNEYLSS